MSAVLQEIEAIYARHGTENYGEGVTMLQHSLQTAALAAHEGANDALIIAALLHDIGHFLQPTDDSYGYHRHDQSGGQWLARHFAPEVSEPVRLHVAAKRYLCAAEPGYHARLSPASVYTLSKQGGPMSVDEAKAFVANPHAEAAARLRRWDDGGKIEGLHVPEFADYRRMIERLVRA
jgi:gamma-butyrobetaine dioxygenase